MLAKGDHQLCASLPAVPPGQTAHAAATAGCSIQEGEIPREAVCLLEGDGFEPSVPRMGRRHSQIFQVPLISAAQVIAVTHTHLGAGAAMVQPFFSRASSHSIEPGWSTV